MVEWTQWYFFFICNSHHARKCLSPDSAQHNYSVVVFIHISLNRQRISMIHSILFRTYDYKFIDICANQSDSYYFFFLFFAFIRLFLLLYGVYSPCNICWEIYYMEWIVICCCCCCWFRSRLRVFFFFFISYYYDLTQSYSLFICLHTKTYNFLFGLFY